MRVSVWVWGRRNQVWAGAREQREFRSHGAKNYKRGQYCHLVVKAQNLTAVWAFPRACQQATYAPIAAHISTEKYNFQFVPYTIALITESLYPPTCQHPFKYVLELKRMTLTFLHTVFFFATIVFFNRKILYSLNQTTRCQTFMDIFKKTKQNRTKKKDTKWN